MKLFAAVLVLVAAVVSAQVTLPGGRVIVEPDVACDVAGWTRGARVVDERMVKMTFAVRQQNLDKLEKLFWEVSDPQHKNYGKFLTQEQVAKLVAPKPEHLKSVLSYVRQFSDDVRVNAHSDLVVVRLPASAAEKMLGVHLHEYTHATEDVMLVRGNIPYSLPAEVAAAVDIVEGANRFPDVRRARFEPMSAEERAATKATAGSWPTDCKGCSSPSVTPAVLKQRYKINAQGGAAGNAIAVAEFQGQYYEPSDLSSFLTECGLPDTKVSKVIGPNGSPGGIEAELDIEVVMGVAVGVPSFFISLEEYSLYDWIVQVSNMTDGPLVHSVSYGNDEAQNSKSYMKRTDAEFQKMATTGVSILFASGDQGVDGREGPSLFKFHPDFPAGSAYVTAVGGTEFVGTDMTQEVGTSWSGGGFSGITSLPSYQKDAVGKYMASGVKMPPSHLYSKGTRGYPDVAANCGNKIPYCIFANGGNTGVAGTSASCPTVASIFALLNDARLKAGKAPLGFLNPFIYQTAAANPNAFFDITSGENKSTGLWGFRAAAGWDPVTGVGSPNFEELLKAI